MRHRIAVSAAMGALLLLSILCPAQTEPQTIGAFGNLLAVYTVDGMLSAPGAFDWYQFDVLVDAAVFLIGSADAGVGLRVVVYDRDESFLAIGEDEIVEVSLSPGTYRVRVDSMESTTGPYSLLITNGTESESNDGIGEAESLGEILTPVMLISSLVPAGDVDFYRFEIPAGGLLDGADAIHVETQGPTGEDTLVVLYRYDDVAARYLPIAFDDDSGDGLWSRLLLRVSPGERYVARVQEVEYPFRGIDRYVFAIKPASLRVDAEPNDTAATATDLDVDADGRSWSAVGTLDETDPVDFVRFTLPTFGLVQAATGPQGDLGDFDTVLSIYDDTGVLVAENDDSGDTYWSRVGTTLEPGDYVVAIGAGIASPGLVPYRLSITVRGLEETDEIEPNGGADTAMPIPWSAAAAVIVNASIDPEDDVDAFQLTLASETTVVFETGPSADALGSYDTTLTLYDDAMIEIAYNDDADGSWSRIEQTLSAGTYVVVVESFFGDEVFDYTLTISEP